MTGKRNIMRYFWDIHIRPSIFEGVLTVSGLESCGRMTLFREPPREMKTKATPIAAV